jgi:RNA polymerase sigma-70 factor (sigma-E family)
MVLVFEPTPEVASPPALRVRRPRSVTLSPTERTVMSSDADFAVFVRAQMPSLSRTAYLLTGSTASAQDLVQDTLLRLYQRRDWVLAADVPLAYARRALANQFVNDRRKPARREIILADVPERHAAPDGSHAVVERDAMWRLLATLPDRQRAALVLRFYDDLPDAEIAEALGARIGTVRSLISRALSALRESPEMESIGGGRR